MAEVHGVGHGSEDGDGEDHVGVDGHAAVAGDVENVEVEGIYEEGEEAGDEEDAVPLGDDAAAGVQDAARLPRPPPAQAWAHLGKMGKVGEAGDRRHVVAEREGRRRRYPPGAEHDEW